MRYFLYAFFVITMFFAAGCASSELIIEVVGPNEALLSGVEVECRYQTRKSPADKMPFTDRKSFITDDQGRIHIVTKNYIAGVQVSIQHGEFTVFEAKIIGFPGMPDKGFEPDQVEHPYTIEDVRNVPPNIIRIQLGYK